MEHEVAIASASQRHFHEDAVLHVKIDRESGLYKTYRDWIVASEEDPEFHIETHIKVQDSELELND